MTWRNFTRHLQVNSRLSHLLQIVKCLQIFQGLNPKVCIKVKEKKKKKKVVVLCFRPPWNSAHSPRISRAATAKKCRKKRHARAKLLLNLLLFWGRCEGFQIWHSEKRIFTSIERELHVIDPLSVSLSACTYTLLPLDETNLARILLHFLGIFILGIFVLEVSLAKPFLDYINFSLYSHVLLPFGLHSALPIWSRKLDTIDNMDYFHRFCWNSIQWDANITWRKKWR